MHPLDFTPFPMDKTKRPVRWSTLLDLNADKIIEKLETNRICKVGKNLDMKNLPIFTDLAQYGVSKGKQLELFSLRIRRLVQIVNSGSVTQLGVDADWFGQSDSDGYGLLDKLAQRLKHSIRTCVHDLELLMLEYNPENSEIGHFRTAREGLLRGTRWRTLPRRGTT